MPLSASHGMLKHTLREDLVVSFALCRVVVKIRESTTGPGIPGAASHARPPIRRAGRHRGRPDRSEGPTSMHACGRVDSAKPCRPASRRDDDLADLLVRLEVA